MLLLCLYLFVRVLQITLVGVEHYGFFGVILSHHFECDSRDGWLEVGLLGVNHNTNVKVLGSLETEARK